METGELNSIYTIPSVKTLIGIDSLTYLDKEIFEKSIFEQLGDHLEFDFKHLKKN